MQRSIASFTISTGIIRFLPHAATTRPLSTAFLFQRPQQRSSSPTVSLLYNKRLAGVHDDDRTVKRIRSVCWISFWAQLALSLVSAGILFFTLATSRARPVSSLFLLVGVASALISTGIVRKILDDTRRLIAVDDSHLTFAKWNGVGWLMRNSDINLIGMASSIVALQGECGTLVAKLLRTSSATTPYAVPSQGAPASIDVFAVQGCANVLLAHFVSLFFLTFALRLLQGLQAKKAAAAIDGLV